MGRPEFMLCPLHLGRDALWSPLSQGHGANAASHRHLDRQRVCTSGSGYRRL